MATLSTPISYRVGDDFIDANRHILRRADGEKIQLSPKVFAVLVYLLENRHRLVSRQELLELFWSESRPNDDALTQCIVDLRRAFADTPRRPRYLETVPRVGFRFIGAVREVGSGMAAGACDEITVAIREECGTSTRLPVKRGYLIGALTVAVLAMAGITASTLRSHSLARPAPARSGKQRIAVLRFENSTGWTDLDWLCDGIPELLANTLSRSRMLDVVGREQFASRIGRWHGNDLTETLESAGRSHADAAIVGSFSRADSRFRVEARAYDARSGGLVAMESASVENPERMLREVDVLGARLAGRLAHGAVRESRREDGSGPSFLPTNNLEAYRYYVLGLDESDARHIDEAIPLFRKALAADPHFAMAYARIGYAYAFHRAQLAEGRPYLEKALGMPEKLADKDRRRIAAWYAVANQDYPEAIRRFRALIAADPNDSEAYYRLAVLMRSEARQEEAAELLRQALVLDPENPNLYSSLSANLSEIGRHSEAIDMARRYVALAPREASAFDMLGLALRLAGRYDEAESAFDQALAMKPDFEMAAFHRAALYMQMGQERKGIAEFRRQAEAAGSPDLQSRCWAALAWYAWRRGRMQEARDAILSARRAAPDIAGWSPATLLLPVNDDMRSNRTLPNPGTGRRYGLRTQYFYLAQEAGVKGHTGDMLTDLREALRYHAALADSEPLEDALADGYLGTGQVDEAIVEYERALKVVPGMALAQYHLAQAYRQKGRNGKARTEFRRFLKTWSHADPALPEIAEARRWVQ